MDVSKRVCILILQYNNNAFNRNYLYRFKLIVNVHKIKKTISFTPRSHYWNSNFVDVFKHQLEFFS